jgi:Uma2 family endonuclease
MALETQQFQELLHSPRLAQYARQIQAVLNEEANRRQAFYAQISEGDKAEFINGEIILHSPVRLRHNSSFGNLYLLLKTYVMVKGLGYVGHEKIMISLTRNDYEPDICYFNKAKSDLFRPDQMRFPAPDFVAEVLSGSTAANDRGVKWVDYAAHGIAEYWIIDPDAETLEQHRLQGDAYELVIKAKTGKVESFSIPGFIIPIRAIFDETENQAALQMLLGY